MQQHNGEIENRSFFGERGIHGAPKLSRKGGAQISPTNHQTKGLDLTIVPEKTEQKSDLCIKSFAVFDT